MENRYRSQSHTLNSKWLNIALCCQNMQQSRGVDKIDHLLCLLTPHVCSFVWTHFSIYELSNYYLMQGHVFLPVPRTANHIYILNMWNPRFCNLNQLQQIPTTNEHHNFALGVDAKGGILSVFPVAALKLRMFLRVVKEK